MTTTATHHANVPDLLQAGQAALSAGDTLRARARFRRATELDPSCIPAWLALSASLPILAERKECIERVLSLDTQHADARKSLQQVEQLLREGASLAPRAGQPEIALAGEVAASAPETLTCAAHPERETGLRCVECERPICSTCARMTSVGQVCAACRPAPVPVQAPRAPTAIDQITGLMVTLGIAMVGGVFIQTLGFGAWFVGLLAGALVGETLVGLLDRFTSIKRLRSTRAVILSAVALGVLLGLTADLTGFGGLLPELVLAQLGLFR
jgi:hypothetical protein